VWSGLIAVASKESFDMATPARNTIGFWYDGDATEAAIRG
jgi:hypothetical protein